MWAGFERDGRAGNIRIFRRLQNNNDIEGERMNQLSSGRVGSARVLKERNTGRIIKGGL